MRANAKVPAFTPYLPGFSPVGAALEELATSGAEGVGPSSPAEKWSASS